MAKNNAEESVWNPDNGLSTDVLTVTALRRAPYHTKLKEFASSLVRDLASLDLRELHSRSWYSRVSTCDIPDDGRLSSWDVGSCQFDIDKGVYKTRTLEELRSRVLLSSVPTHGRLIVGENVLPATMEILGSSLSLDPALFQRHIAHAWGPRNESISASAGSSAWPGTCDDFVLRSPRLYAVSHPSALERKDWREECLFMAARHRQCRRLMPLLDLPGKIDCVALEHVTISIQADWMSHVGSSSKWRAIVLFPMAVKECTEGDLHVEKYMTVDPRPVVRAMRARYVTDNQISYNRDVGNWMTALKTTYGGVLGSPFTILESLWRETLLHWRSHLTHIALTVETLSSTSNIKSDDRGLAAQQQVREIIVHESAVLSEILDSLDTAIIANTDLRNVQESEVTFEACDNTGFESLKVQFGQVKTQLERHLPTLQHHMDIFVIQQQVRLAETQLEESRKAIQQADTIKRLTILAFIYIPIQTAASIFGMNMRELKDNPSVWVFVATAAVLLAATISAAGWQHILPLVHKMQETLRIRPRERSSLAESYRDPFTKLEKRRGP